MEKKNKELKYRYEFTFSNGEKKDFTITLDKASLLSDNNKNTAYPYWCDLQFNKCPNCPLNDEENKYCPATKNLVDIVKYFSDLRSSDEVDVFIESNERNYYKHTSLQSGLSSLVGLCMVTSGCPKLDKLRPMICTHLPFSTVEETSYRVLSMYLLGQYLLFKNNKTPDWDLKNLSTMYEEIVTVNKSFCKRLTAVIHQDASINAVVILNNFANIIYFAIDQNMLDEIKQIFTSYLK